MLEAPSIIILSFNLTHLKYGHLFSVGWRNWKVMQKKKEKTEYVFRWKEDKLSFVIYVTNTLAHTPRRAFLWTDFPFISLKTTPLTEAETAACLTAITSISTKILSRRLAPTQWQTNYIKAFPPLREQNSFSYQYQDKYNGFVIVIF